MKVRQWNAGERLGGLVSMSENIRRQWSARILVNARLNIKVSENDYNFFGDIMLTMLTKEVQ